MKNCSTDWTPCMKINPMAELIRFFYDRKSLVWKSKQDGILCKIERFQTANRSYLDEGVKLLELAQRAVNLYQNQTGQEKRRIINFVCSNSIWKDGRLIPNYRQSFDILA
jgi:site-specific DNA recombinase